MVTTRGRKPWEDRIADVFTGQGRPKTAGKPSEVRKRQGRILLQVTEGAWPLLLDFELPGL